jgi:hypothetical protein
MRIAPCLLGSTFLVALAFQPASAANVSVSFGQADFEMLYEITVDGNSVRGQSIGDFDYVDLGISVDRGDYTYGFTASSLLEQPVDELHTIQSVIQSLFLCPVIYRKNYR